MLPLSMTPPSATRSSTSSATPRAEVLTATPVTPPSIWEGGADHAQTQERRAPDAVATNPLIFINACESSDLFPKFYAGFVPYFLAKGARGVIGTECKVPVVFAWSSPSASSTGPGRQAVGDCVLAVRRELVEQHGNPLGLMYAVHCDANTG